MEKGVFIFFVALLVYVRSAHVSLETVWLKDMTTRFTTEKRTFSNLDLPDELIFNIRRVSGDLTLNLKRNHDIDPNADIYFATKSKHGRSVLVKSPNLKKEDVAYYQDIENGAFMTVRCVKRSNGQCDRDINGNIQIGGNSYDLRAAQSDVTSRHLLEFPGLHGKRYVLQNQAYIQRENSVENKDAGNVKEIEKEQNVRALFRRVQEQHRQNNFPRSDATLSSRNVTSLHNRAGTEKSRQLKTVYYVKVAVLIDSETWELYSSMVSSSDPVTRDSQTEKKIKESYSHVMNGANMRYKGIQDPSISIHVILSRFIYFKRKEDFTLKHSKVIEYDGEYYIDASKYLDDLSKWDQDIGNTSAPSYDLAMLFTRYNLFLGNLLDALVEGYSYNDMVCNVGFRVSIVQATDYFSTSLVAAHELGHNLGADHDGEINSTSCKAEDCFVMTPKVPKANPAEPISRNFWIFSNCSVEAFKRILKDKDCVTHPGSFYNEQEYTAYVMSHPGEVYTPNDQCHVIIGPGSIYCGPVPVDSCYLKCTDPSTGMCKNIYHHTAKGTQCGENMWCVEARCVPKLSILT